MQDGYTIEFPDHLNSDPGIWEAKGYVTGVTIRFRNQILRPTFYDPVRLGQDAETEIRDHAFMALHMLVIVPAITREAIEEAVRRLAKTDFVELFEDE